MNQLSVGLPFRRYALQEATAPKCSELKWQLDLQSKRVYATAFLDEASLYLI